MCMYIILIFIFANTEVNPVYDSVSDHTVTDL